jgi:acyl dehydratase
MMAFARRFDPQPFHLDEEAAKANPVLGRLCASGWFTASLWMRAWFEVIKDSTVLASPGGTNLRWPAPVFAGGVAPKTLSTLVSAVTRGRLGAVAQPGAGP